MITNGVSDLILNRLRETDLVLDVGGGRYPYFRADYVLDKRDMDERIGRGADWSPGLVSPIAWDDVTFVFGDHLGMTRDPSFTDNVLYRLLDAPRPGQRARMRAAAAAEGAP